MVEVLTELVLKFPQGKQKCEAYQGDFVQDADLGQGFYELKGGWEKGLLRCLLLSRAAKCWCPQTPVEMGEKVLDGFAEEFKASKTEHCGERWLRA